MKRLNKKARELIESVVTYVVGEKGGLKGVYLAGDADNPFAYLVVMSLENDEQLVVRTCNELFHELHLLPPGKNLALGELGDYCQVIRGASSDGENYSAYFNHPAVFELKPTDPERRFILKTWRDWDGE